MRKCNLPGEIFNATLLLLLLLLLLLIIIIGSVYDPGQEVEPPYEEVQPAG
jgi:hypothetical protein